MNNWYQNNENEVSNQNGMAAPRKKKTGRKMLKKACAFVLCGALFGGSASLAFQGVDYLFEGDSAETASTASQQETTAALQTVAATSDGDSTSQSLDVSDIAQSVMPAMVSITSTSVEEVESYFGMFGRGQSTQQEVESSGSCCHRRKIIRYPGGDHERDQGCGTWRFG